MDDEALLSVATLHIWLQYSNCIHTGHNFLRWSHSYFTPFFLRIEPPCVGIVPLYRFKSASNLYLPSLPLVSLHTPLPKVHSNPFWCSQRDLQRTFWVLQLGSVGRPPKWAYAYLGGSYTLRATIAWSQYNDQKLRRFTKNDEWTFCEIQGVVKDTWTFQGVLPRLVVKVLVIVWGASPNNIIELCGMVVFLRCASQSRWNLALGLKSACAI